MREHSPEAEATALPPDGDEGSSVSAVSSAPQPTQVAGWFALQQRDTQASRDWAMALRKPIEYSLEDLRQRPNRAAQLLAPVMDAALVEHRKHRLADLEERGRKCVAIIANPKLWSLSIRALWEGEPVWEYLERRSGWYQVVEAVLVGSGTNQLLGRAEAKGVRALRGDASLLDQIQVPTEGPASNYPDSSDDDELAGKSHVMVLVGVHCKLAVRVCGQPPEKLRQSLQELCQEADHLLERSTMDTSSRASMIERLLSRALFKNSPATAPWSLQTAAVIGIVAAHLIVGLVAYYGKQERQWQNVVQNLSNEPGLQIVGETTSWGKREIRGLRDPLARDPVEILREAGIDPSEVVLKFKSYLSAEDPILQKRQNGNSRTVMATPPSVIAKPAAKPSEPEIKPAQPLSQVEPKAEAEAKPMPNTVESIVINFQPGTEKFTTESEAKLAELAREVRHLQELAATNAKVLHITFQVQQVGGDKDDSLWQFRHTAVRDALRQSGVSNSAIDPEVAVPSSSTVVTGNPDQVSLRISIESPPAKP